MLKYRGIEDGNQAIPGGEFDPLLGHKHQKTDLSRQRLPNWSQDGTRRVPETLQDPALTLPRELCIFFLAFCATCVPPQTASTPGASGYKPILGGLSFKDAWKESVVRLMFVYVTLSLLAHAAMSQPLFEAVRRHDLHKVKTILSSPVDINQEGPGGLTPLLLAIRTGDSPICKELLDNGADPNAKGDSTLTPLMEASARGVYTIVESLIKKGAEVNVCAKMTEGLDGEPLSNPRLDLSGSSVRIDAVEKSALILAAEGEHLSVARLLLDNGAEINRQAEWFVTAAGARYVAMGRTALMCAVQTRFDGLVKLLLQKKADVGIQERAVAMRGNEADSMIGEDADLTERLIFTKHSTALHIAAEACDRTIASALLDAGAALEIRDGMNSTPLVAAIRNGCTPVAELLVERGADVHADRNTPGSPVILAAARGKSRLVDLLIKAGASINQKAGELGTPLISWAVIGGNRQVVRSLLEHGADVNATTNDKSTPLMIAADRGEANIVRFLIAQRAKLNSRNNEGRTALMLASMKGRGECVKALLAGGADGTIQDNNGETALVHALKEGDQQIVKLLREGGPATVKVQSIENDRLSDLIEFFSAAIEEHDYSVLQYLAFSKPYGKWDVRPLRVASIPSPDGNGTFDPAEVSRYVWGVVSHRDYRLPPTTTQNVPVEFLKEGFEHKQRYCKNFYPPRRLALNALLMEAERSTRSIFVRQNDLAGGEGYERVNNVYRQNGIYWRYVVPHGSPFEMSTQVDTLRGYRYSTSDESILKGLSQAGCYCMVKVNGYLVFMTGGLLGHSIGFIHGKTRPKPGSLRPLFGLSLVEDLGDGFYFYVSR